MSSCAVGVRTARAGSRLRDVVCLSKAFRVEVKIECSFDESVDMGNLLNEGIIIMVARSMTYIKLDEGSARP